MWLEENDLFECGSDEAGEAGRVQTMWGSDRS